MRKMVYLIVAVVAVAAAATDALAGQVAAVPEINPASVSAALAVVAGGVLLARARWGKK